MATRQDVLRFLAGGFSEVADGGLPPAQQNPQRTEQVAPTDTRTIDTANRPSRNNLLMSLTSEQILTTTVLIIAGIAIFGAIRG